MDVNRFEDSDSDDEFLMYVAARARQPKNIRPRTNHLEFWNDEEFFMRFRLTKPTVLHLLNLIEHQLEHPTNRNGSVAPINQLLLCLRFYATGNMLISVGDFSGVHKTTAGRFVRKVTYAIATLRPQYVRFPETQEGIRQVQHGFYQMNRFPRVVAAIDCTHIRIQSPGGNNAEVFRNRKGWFSFNVQTLCDHKMKIMDIVARWPGSAHDLNIFNNSSIKARLEMGEFGDSVILGDSGYTLQPYLLTPLRNPARPEEHLYNEAQIRTRTTVERSYGIWKRRFPALSLGLRLSVEHVQAIIVACAILHNIAVDMNEEEPPHNPELPQVDIDGDQVVQDVAVEGNAPVQHAFIDYFRNLL